MKLLLKLGNRSNMENELILSQESIENRIYSIRGKQVMLDRDLAEMYQVETRALNQAVSRNIDRCPSTFRFQLSEVEFENWKSQFVMSKNDKMGLRRAPYAFTEQGVAMLSAVLKSHIAVKVSLQIMNAFVQMRELIGQHTIQQLRLNNVENKLIEHDQKFNQLFQALEKNELPQKGVFYDGQVFDAYHFVAGIIRKATTSIVVIDNYVDDTVLTLFSKRKKQVACTIYTKKISKSLQLDVEKHNTQHPTVELKELANSHDRFMIIDGKDLYHIGASLKDLGKKWFAFSRMDGLCGEVLNKLAGGKD